MSLPPDAPSLDAVLATAELRRRPSRPPDHRAESAALGVLAQALADSPSQILEALVEVALELSGAGSAGISLLDDADDAFHWSAIAGAWKPLAGGGMPRDASPCGVVLERDAVQLFVRPERHFRYEAPIAFPIVEALLTPFHVDGKVVGTVWLIAHDERRRFDAEDARQLTSLAHFASAAYQTEQAAAASERQSAALRISEERYRSLSQAITSIVWTAGAEGGFVEPQASWAAYTGQSQDELRGFGWTLAIHPDDRERVRRRWTRTCASRAPYHETGRLWHAASRGHRHIEVRGVPILEPDGSLREWVGTCIDVEDRWKAMAELQRHREDLGSFIHQSPVPTCVVRGPELVFESVSPSYLTLVSGRRVLGRPLLDALPELRGQGIAEQLHEVMRTGEPIVGNEVLIRLQREGRLQDTWWTFIYSPLHAPDGTTRRVVALCNDVTEQRRMLDALREGDRRKNEFLAMLAHELRNPLAPIRTATALLRTASSGEQAARAQEMMERQLGHMVRLIDDLVDASRISRGRIELRKERVDLAALVEGAADAARPACEDKGLTLDVALPDGPVPVDGDPTRLTQVLDNLLSNARKFTPAGGRIELGVGRAGGDALLQLRDTGIGIPPDQLHYVFELFTQVERGLHRGAEGGLGIGLALSKQLVEMHGGRVELQSAGRGEGTEVTVRLPCATEAAGASPEPPEPPAAPRSAVRRVLVVDDNRDAADSLAMLLRLRGHEVATAYDGLEALDGVAQHRPDLVLLDIGLPKLDGYEVARRIRAQNGPDVRLVAVTGWGQEEDRRRSAGAGFDAHLVKPIDSAALKEVLGTSPA